ncbi:MAG: hypothetical protein AAF636_16240 [Pseudomonadota bacterium]
MVWNLSLAFGVVVTASLAAPITAMFNGSGKRDTAGLYFVLDPLAGAARETILSAFGARLIGLERAPLAVLISADNTSHAKLVQAGHWVVPAGTLAAICGLQPRQPDV